MKMKKFPQLDIALKQNKISRAAYKNILLWLSDKKYKEFWEELQDLINNNQWEKLNDAFSKDLPFGTNGRRGKVGIGSNRINKITIGETAQGLADYLKNHSNKKIVVSFDVRLTSEVFAHYVASIFAANGFLVYIFDGPRPTPELCFALNYLNAVAGIMITASHNLPQDNGIKIYFQNGAILSEESSEIIKFAKKTKEISEIDFIQAKEDKKIKIIGKEVDESYINSVISESLDRRQRSAKIVYSPLHGTGIKSVLPVLQKAGFKNVFLVEEQAEQNGNFPTLKNNKPDPQLEECAEMTIKKCREVEADLGIFSDPDADRLGAVIRNNEGQYIFLNGNQIASLLGFFILDFYKRQKKLKPENYIVKTLVTTDLLSDLADYFGVKIYGDLLVGYKYIINKINKTGPQDCLFSAEDTNGFLKGNYTKDKDAAITALLLCEYASFLKNQRRNLIWQLDNLYRQFGLYLEKSYQINVSGQPGMEKIEKIMKNLRQKSPKEILGEKIIKTEDYFIKSNSDSNVLVFYLSEDGKNKIIIRPSGTEPSLKVYTNLYKKVDKKISDEDLDKEKFALRIKSQKILEFFEKKYF